MSLKQIMEQPPLIVLVLCVCSAVAYPATALADGKTASNEIAALFSELNALNSPNYTGGLSRRNRDLAEKIREAMRPEFPQIPCQPPDAFQGTLVHPGDAKTGDAVPDEKIDPNLAVLLKALNHDRQEVRDTATYTIGLLGPSAAVAVPLIEDRLRQNFSKNRLKGNWHNDTFSKLKCISVTAPDFRQVIPDRLLPPEKPWNDFLAKSAILMAQLYLDEDIEYPPNMMGGAYGNYAIADQADAAAPLFAKILENKNLSVQKHTEAARALTFLKPEVARIALPGLLRHTDSENEQLRSYVTDVLVRLKHGRAIPLLVRRIQDGYIHWGWEDELCAFGPTARSAEDALLDIIAAEETWPSVARGAVNALGCIKPRKAIPTLIELLKFPDWETRKSIAIALGKIGEKRRRVRVALVSLADKHWSKQVREAASQALVDLGLRRRKPQVAGATPKASDDEDIIVIAFGPVPVDHGLPWCDESGNYSLDGSHWFTVKWQAADLVEIPKGFPAVELPDFGSRAFFRVEDGWLVGADLGHYDGFFWHVSDDGKITELDEPRHTDIVGYFRKGTKILAFGYQVMKGGDGGSLFEVYRRKDGKWTSRRIAALPSPPNAHATGPDGELLLSDGPNDYAFISGEIVPLQCEKVKEGSFFDRD